MICAFYECVFFLWNVWMFVGPTLHKTPSRWVRCLDPKRIRAPNAWVFFVSAFLVAMIHTKKYALTKDQYWKNPQNPPKYVIYLMCLHPSCNGSSGSSPHKRRNRFFCCICKFLWNFINYPRIRSGLVLPHLHPTSLTSGFSTMSSTKPICRRSVDCGMAADNKRSSAGCCPVIFIINLWHWKKRC